MQSNNYTQTIKNKCKEAIIMTAAELFLNNGIENIKMTDIAESCGIGVATLYRYFGTKTGILVAAGSLIWKDIELLFDGVFDCPFFKAKTGKEQIVDLLKVFTVLFTSHKNFLKFVADFDSYVIANSIGQDMLKDYEKSVLNYYPMFYESYICGCKDGSVKKEIDFKSFYFSITHALISMSQKFIKGEILESDNFSFANKELDIIIDMAANYISA